MALTIPEDKQFKEPWSKKDIAVDLLHTSTDIDGELQIAKSEKPVVPRGNKEFTFGKLLDFSGPLRANMNRDEIGGTGVLTKMEHISRPKMFPDITKPFETGYTRPYFGKSHLEDPMEMFGIKKLASADNTYELTSIKNAPKSIHQATEFSRHRDFAENAMKNIKPRRRSSASAGNTSGGGGDGTGGGGDGTGGGGSNNPVTPNVNPDFSDTETGTPSKTSNNVSSMQTHLETPKEMRARLMRQKGPYKMTEAEIDAAVDYARTEGREVHQHYQQMAAANKIKKSLKQNLKKSKVKISPAVAVSAPTTTSDNAAMDSAPVTPANQASTGSTHKKPFLLTPKNLSEKLAEAKEPTVEEVKESTVEEAKEEAKDESKLPRLHIDVPVKANYTKDELDSVYRQISKFLTDNRKQGRGSLQREQVEDIKNILDKMKTPHTIKLSMKKISTIEQDINREWNMVMKSPKK
jgi:hypothetical protein